MPRGSPFRTAIRAPGSAWPNNIPTSAPAPAISTRAGKSSIRKNGCRTITLACGSIPAAPAARPASSIISRRARPRISTTASNGPASQPWSNGKVGLNGISYYGINQWHVASLQPPHLAAMCIWEGAADWYRDMTHHGGILCTFWENWYDMQVKTVQYGVGERGKRSRVHGELVCGPEFLSDAELAKNRSNFGGDIVAHPARRRLSPRPLAGMGEGQGAVSVGGQLGRPAVASARQFRGVRARGVEAEMAGSARHRALDAFLHRLRPQSATALLRLFLARQEERLGQRTAGAAPGPSSRPLRRARGE